MNLANRITVVRIAMIPLIWLCLQPFPVWLTERSGVLLWQEQYGVYAAFGLFLLAAATDRLDGAIARARNEITRLGKLLDPLADKLLIAMAMLMLVQTGTAPAWAVAAILGRELAITVFRVHAARQGLILAADRYGKWKLVLQVGAIAGLLVQQFPVWTAKPFPFGEVLLVAAAVLTVWSGFRYLAVNRRLIQ